MAENNGVAILTDAYWRQRLDADPNVLGRDVLVNGIPRKIVGVLPADFRFLSSEARLFLPIRSRPEEHAPSQRHSGGGGRHLDYFLAFGIPPREGRFLNAEDSRRPERVCVVDEDFARRYWPRGGGGGALGQQIFHPGITYTGKSTVEEGETFTIVGVVGTVKQAELTEAQGRVRFTCLTPTAATPVSSSSRARARIRKRSPRRCESWCARRIPSSRSITSAP